MPSVEGWQSRQAFANRNMPIFLTPTPIRLSSLPAHSPTYSKHKCCSLVVFVSSNNVHVEHLGECHAWDLSFNIGLFTWSCGGCPVIRLLHMNSKKHIYESWGERLPAVIPIPATPDKLCIDRKTCTQNIRLLGRSAPMTSHVCENVGKHLDNNNWKNHGDRLVDCGVLY